MASTSAVASTAAPSFPAEAPSSLPPGGESVGVDPKYVRVVIGSPPDPSSNAIVYLTIPVESTKSPAEASPAQVYETAHVQVYDQRGTFQVDPARFVFVDATGEKHEPLSSAAGSLPMLGVAQLSPRQYVVGDLVFDAPPGQGLIELVDSNGTMMCSWIVSG